MIGAANVYFLHEGFIGWSPVGTPGVRHWYMYGTSLATYGLVFDSSPFHQSIYTSKHITAKCEHRNGMNITGGNSTVLLVGVLVRVICR